VRLDLCPILSVGPRIHCAQWPYTTHSGIKCPSRRWAALIPPLPSLTPNTLPCDHESLLRRRRHFRLDRVRVRLGFPSLPTPDPQALRGSRDHGLAVRLRRQFNMPRVPNPLGWQFPGTRESVGFCHPCRTQGERRPPQRSRKIHLVSISFSTFSIAGFNAPSFLAAARSSSTASSTSGRPRAPETSLSCVSASNRLRRRSLTPFSL
jgi:hypothetical protein